MNRSINSVTRKLFITGLRYCTTDERNRHELALFLRLVNASCYKMQRCTFYLSKKHLKVMMQWLKTSVIRSTSTKNQKTKFKLNFTNRMSRSSMTTTSDPRDALEENWFQIHETQFF